MTQDFRAERIAFGVGSHEPILHRIRTGDASADEWRRWERETSSENLDLLDEMGISQVMVACTKGFGLEVEKPLIERAARLREQCHRRDMRCEIYLQGLPVYYETFLIERPEAEHWLARKQDGAFMPWGGQMFRRWMDPHSEAFLEYECELVRYAMHHVQPDGVLVDNTIVPQLSYTQRSAESFRRYLREKFAGQDPIRLFGIPSFDRVELPQFDPVYYPPDAMRIVKDPLLQELTHWRAQHHHDWISQIGRVIHDVLPGACFSVSGGCDPLRYNHLFNRGVDYHLALSGADAVTLEESGWRPRVFIQGSAGSFQPGQDGRSPGDEPAAQETSLRVSTDARWTKIIANHGHKAGFGFWGEFDKVDQEIAAAHGMTFAGRAYDFGTIGPLAAHARQFDPLRPVMRWASRHVALLDGRDERLSAAAVWRGTASTGFIRHRPVWAACAVEQMLFERHLPFTILLDEHLEAWLTGRRVLLLPMTCCISDVQASMIRDFVHAGGGLLLLGDAGTRDERTRVRQRHAFADMLPADALDQIERIGPPHFVPEVHIAGLTRIVRSTFGRGRVSLVPDMPPRQPLDLTRDPYMPWREVMPKDVQPPANDQAIWDEIAYLMQSPPPLRIDGPRHTLCEYWRQDADLLVCAANLHPQRDGGPITLHLPGAPDATVSVYELHEDEPREMRLAAGKLTIDRVPRFVAIRAPGLSVAALQATGAGS
ncbi:MAG: hypothetical protein WD118_10365 [Phycisphaeraceae bacterium]